MRLSSLYEPDCIYSIRNYDIFSVDFRYFLLSETIERTLQTIFDTPFMLTIRK